MVRCSFSFSDFRVITEEHTDPQYSFAGAIGDQIVPPGSLEWQLLRIEKQQHATMAEFQRTVNIFDRGTVMVRGGFSLAGHIGLVELRTDPDPNVTSGTLGALTGQPLEGLMRLADEMANIQTPLYSLVENLEASMPSPPTSSQRQAGE